MTTFTPPPNWPQPPPGWAPPPGWQPDPSWPPAPPGWNFWPARGRAWALDRAVAESPDQGWSIWLGILPVLALIGVLVAEAVIGSFAHFHVSTLVAWLLLPLTVAHYVAAIAVIIVLGHAVVQRSGGWGPAFGWRRPRWPDLPIGFSGAIAEFVARAAAGLILVILIPALRNKAQSNVDLHDKSVAYIAVMLFLAVVVAPPVEELMFRGVLLRALMKRLPAVGRMGRFWPAALVSSAIFGLLHLYEVHGWAAMVLLFTSIFVFGLGQCLLVRWTGRLATSITAHALSNLGAALLTLAVR